MDAVRRVLSPGSLRTMPSCLHMQINMTCRRWVTAYVAERRKQWSGRVFAKGQTILHGFAGDLL